MKPKKHLIFIMFLSVVITAVVFPSLFAEENETMYVDKVPCDFECYVIGEDPSGISVRSGPSIDSPVIATIPRDYEIIVHVGISGSVGEWIRIDYYDVLSDTESKEYNIDGWISGPGLGLRAKAYGLEGAVVPLYEEPSTDAPILTRLQSDAEGAVIGCQGEWVKINYNGVEGWLEPGTYCGAALTDCC